MLVHAVGTITCAFVEVVTQQVDSIFVLARWLALSLSLRVARRTRRALGATAPPASLRVRPGRPLGLIPPFGATLARGIRRHSRGWLRHDALEAFVMNEGTSLSPWAFATKPVSTIGWFCGGRGVVRVTLRRIQGLSVLNLTLFLDMSVHDRDELRVGLSGIRIEFPVPVDTRFEDSRHGHLFEQDCGLLVSGD